MKKTGYIVLLVIFMFAILVPGCIDRDNTPGNDSNVQIDIPKRPHYEGDNPDVILEDTLAKSEIISLSIEENIDRLEADGKDVEELEDLLNRYNQFIKQARENQTLAHSNADSEIKKKHYYFEAGKNLRESDKVLKEIFEKFKIISPGYVELDGKNKLIAEGNGIVSFRGDIRINLSMAQGTMAISDYSGDKKIATNASYEIVNFPKSRDKEIIYRKIKGNMDISGSNLMVMAHGNDIFFEATGKGEIVMSGNGTYNQSMDERYEVGRWMTTLDRK